MNYQDYALTFTILNKKSSRRLSFARYPGYIQLRLGFFSLQWETKQ
jgi:hypothetical protein